MNATPLPPSRRRALAAAAIQSWTTWRFSKALRDALVDAGVLASMLIVWACAYMAVCPPEPTKNIRHVDFAQVLR